MAYSLTPSVNSCSLKKASPPDHIATRNHRQGCVRASARESRTRARTSLPPRHQGIDAETCGRRGGVELAGPGQARRAPQRGRCCFVHHVSRGARNPHAATRGACRLGAGVRRRATLPRAAPANRGRAGGGSLTGLRGRAARSLASIGYSSDSHSWTHALARPRLRWMGEC